MKQPSRTTQILTLIAIASLGAASLAPAKPFPGGIIRLFSTGVSKPGNDPSWKNSNIDGMRLRPAWRDVQTGPATYNWSAIDERISLGTQNGKTIGLSVGAGLNSPQWVYDAGATKYKLQDGSGLSMTLPWDTTFQAKWLAFVRTMGARYDGNPSLGYIVISGLGQNVETYLSQTAKDDAALTAMGGLTAWVAAAKTIISAYADAFPTTPFFITAGRPFTPNAAMTSLQEVIDWGVANYPGRFGIMNATLNANSSTGYYPNLAINTYRDTQPVGFQTLCSSISDPARLGGTLNQALTKGIGLGAEFVEVYQNDADLPGNQSVLAKNGTLLEANLPILAILEMEALTVQAMSGAEYVVFTDDPLLSGAGTLLKSTMVGDFVTYTVPISEAGTYKVKLAIKTNKGKGIFQLAIDGVNQGSTQDEYSSAVGYEVRDLGTVTFGSAGGKAFQFLVTGRNPSSSGYQIVFDYIDLELVQ